MPNYAIVEDSKVLNVIVADSKELAEEISGKTCVEYTVEPAESGGTYENGRFIKAQPYPSWVLDEDFNWQPPVPYPTQEDEENPKIYTWDEDITSWVEITE
jgi:hypothetical protein